MYYSMMCRRYMHDYGEDRTREAMAEIAVATRKWARLNPRALMHDRPMDPRDYHDSPWISWPFHLVDCCLVTDAGAAVVITTEERARDLRKKPVWVLGAAEGHDHDMVSQMTDLTTSIAAETGRKAMATAGVSHSDVDLAVLYDSFTYTALVSLEALGFCGRGEGPDFVHGQRTAPGGDFPLEHQRRRPVLHPPGDVRGLHRRRGGPTAQRRVRRQAGRRLQNGHRPRHRRRYVVDRHGRPG